MDIVKEQSEKYQPLFDLMKDEHDLILVESEMDDIISASEKVKDNFSDKDTRYLRILSFLQRIGILFLIISAVLTFIQDYFFALILTCFGVLLVFVPTFFVNE